MHILSAIKRGDAKAANELLPLVYDELRRLAVQRLALEKPGQTLQPTAPVQFAGLTLDQAAECLGIAPRTADRAWRYARAWLYGPTPTSTLVANSPGLLGTQDFFLPGGPSLPRVRLGNRQREFATSVSVDTGGEFIFLPARELGEDPR